MKFGPVPVEDALGAILAHSVQAGATHLRKGSVLDEDDLAKLGAAGITVVTVARLDPGDIAENTAATTLAAAFCPEPRGDLKLSEAFNGRVNLLAAAPGVLRVDASAVHALNAIDPGITLATLPDHARVAVGTMLATIKIIPYAVPDAAVQAACQTLSAGVLRVHQLAISQADIVLTRTPGFAEKLLAKGERAVRDRLMALGVEVTSVRTVDHDSTAVASAMASCDSPLVLILGASATSDAADVCPGGLIAAGGELTRFGMPVDPGNLLFLGRLGTAQVIGLPGCARSPALNGADWVLERIACGLSVTSDDVAAMGVGGLLKEIPIRPQPRAGRKPNRAPRVDVVLLAAGASRRMRGADKLLQEVDGEPVLRRAARAALASAAARVHVVLPPEGERRAATLTGLEVDRVTATDAAEGMAASLRAGLRAASGADAVVVMLADMPEVTAADLDALISAYDPSASHEICRSVASDGTPGHPVLFGRRFFESLAALSGDQGARSVVAGASDFVIDVETGQGATLDLDTPEQWEDYRRSRGSG